MEAQAWTAIGLLAATLVAALFYLGARIDGLSTRIDNLGARLDGRIDALSTRIDALADRVYRLELKLDDHLRRHAG